MSTGTGLNWQRAAVCVLETPDAPEIWTPDRRPARVVLERLEQMCQRCPVRRRCAGEAIVTGAETGVYAGVWVPQQHERSAWAAARGQLQAIVGAAPDVLLPGDELGVPA